MNRENGAIDLTKCPQYVHRRRGCRCGSCAICGYPKHTAIHGPVNGGAPGSRPYGHQFVWVGEQQPSPSRGQAGS